MRFVLSLLTLVLVFSVAHAEGKTKKQPSSTVTVQTSTIKKNVDGTFTVTLYTITGDPESSAYKKLKAEEEDKLAQYQKEALRAVPVQRYVAQPMIANCNQSFVVSLDNCNRCNTSCSSSCLRCSDNCSSCSRSCGTYCSRGTARNGPPCNSCSRGSSCSSCNSGDIPARGYYCNCARHIAECERLGLDWRATPCRCPHGSMPGEGRSRGSCCGN